MCGLAFIWIYVGRVRNRLRDGWGIALHRERSRLWRDTHRLEVTITGCSFRSTVCRMSVIRAMKVSRCSTFTALWLQCLHSTMMISPSP